MKKIDPRLWLALGMGAGNIRRAPGTWGSLAGLLLSLGMWQIRSQAFYWAALAALFFLSVHLAGHAERVLQQRDPGCVVIDEIVALPFCWLATFHYLPHLPGALPELNSLSAPGLVKQCLAVFLLFRFFDIAKPWPIRQSQSLPGGWGVTVDDILAAGAVNVCMMALYSWKLI